jgi:hypothetical protein
MALKIEDLIVYQKKIGASVTFQDLSYNMLPKKIQIILNYFLLKKGLSANLAAQTTYFQCKWDQIYWFSYICSQFF